MNEINIIEVSCNNGVNVIAQGKNSNVSYIGIRLDKEIKEKLKLRSSGALDTCMVALLKYGLKKLKKEGNRIVIYRDGDKLKTKEEVKKEGEATLAVRCKVSRDKSVPFSMRISTELKEEILKSSHYKSYTIALLGVLNYSLDDLIDNERCLIINGIEKGVKL